MLSFLTFPKVIFLNSLSCCDFVVCITLLYICILGFHYIAMQICSKSEWGSTSTVLMFMLYWKEHIQIGNCTYFATKHEANTYSEQLIYFHDDVSI